MGAYQATLQRIAVRLAMACLPWLLICLNGFDGTTLVVSAIYALCLIGTAIQLIVRRPFLEITADGVRYKSVWNDRSLKWDQIRSVHTGGRGPLTYLAIAGATGWPIYIGQYFAPSSEQLEADINALLANERGQRSQALS